LVLQSVTAAVASELYYIEHNASTRRFKIIAISFNSGKYPTSGPDCKEEGNRWLFSYLIPSAQHEVLTIIHNINIIFNIQLQFNMFDF
jgi:hypothetical protein